MTKHPSRRFFWLAALTVLIGGAGVLVFATHQETGGTQTVRQCTTPPSAPIALPAGSFEMGTHAIYPEEGPPQQVTIGALDIDPTEVTNQQFAAFVAATGYVTDAEKIQPGFGQAGGAVFVVPTPANPSWWQFVVGAHWRQPEGPDSSITGKDHYPVVQISYPDAQAYAAWAGRRLPSEAEWEYAAKAGSTSTYVWGDERAHNDQEMANSWQGTFPLYNSRADGHELRAPVGCFPANEFGLYDMIGNVWEWTATPFPGQAPSVQEISYTLKGGSFLCAPNFCQRYRASARQAQEARFPTNHIGFRTVATLPARR
jgi:formylglycine-generating enzyme required for sulfatase activity